MKDLEIGASIQLLNVEVKCIASKENNCRACFFNKYSDIDTCDELMRDMVGSCYSDERVDKTKIIFVEVRKIINN